MSWLSSFLHPEKGYNAAQKQLTNYFNQAQGNLQPYNQNGQQQYGNLQQYIDSLMHPEKLQDEWIKGYTESGAAKNAEGLATQHGLDAASSMGLMGSRPALDAIQQGTSQISMNDRQNYLDNLMQKYLAGAGISKDIYGTGANVAGQMGQNSMNMGQNSAQLAYNKENASGNLFGNILGTGAGLAATVAGSALGGPIGGALATRWNLSGGK